MKIETIMPRFRSYRPFKADWKYEKKCCKKCNRDFLTDNMMGVKKGSYICTWFCIRCYNLLQKS